MTARGATTTLIVLGFSQGTATAARWITRGTIRPSDVILWGGLLPPEIDLSDAHRRRFASRRCTLSLAHAITSSRTTRVTDEEQRLREANVPHRLVRYTGGHGIVQRRSGRPGAIPCDGA